MPPRPDQPRVLISYAHESDEHRELVRELWQFLCANGIDARVDLSAAHRPRNWPQWMSAEIRAADFVLVVVSETYRRRAEDEDPPDVGRGVRWEAGLIRDDFYRDPFRARDKYLPVLLPGGSPDHIPTWMGGHAALRYQVPRFTADQAEPLLIYLTGRSRPAEHRPHHPAPDDPAHLPDGGTSPVRRTLLARSIRAHDDDVRSVAFHPTRPLLATVSDDADVRLWDLDTGGLTARLTGHQDTVMDVAFSPAGDALATAGYDGTVRVWCPDEGILRHTLRGHGHRLLDLAFSHDGSLLVSAGCHRSAHVWDPRTGTLMRELIHAQAPEDVWIRSVAFAGSSRRLVTAAGPAVTCWNPLATRAGRVLAQRVLTRDGPGGASLIGSPLESYALGFTPDGRTLAVADADGRVHLWDVVLEDVRAPLIGNAGRIRAVEFDRHGDLLAVAGSQDDVRLWDAASGRPVASLPTGADTVHGLAFSPTSDTLAVACQGGEVQLWECS